MTASEPDGGHEASDRSLGGLLLDLFVYVPAGVVATALDDRDEMAEKGRARVDEQLRNAHLVGRLAVDFGVRRVKQQAETLLARVEAPPTEAPPEEEVPRTEPAPRSASATRTPSQPSAGHSPRDPEVDRAIPDYDTLSASQVVRRLDSLNDDELRAIVRHELATRGRRTILHRAEQLLEASPPGSPAAP